MTTKTNYLGIDIAKLTVACCLVEVVTEKRKNKSVKNTPEGFSELVA